MKKFKFETDQDLTPTHNMANGLFTTSLIIQDRLIKVTTDTADPEQIEAALIEEIKRRFRVTIRHASDPESPREWCNIGEMATKHSEYTLGEVEIDDPIEWLEGMLNKGENKWIYTQDRLVELEEEFFDKFIALPLYLYDHSGITISTTPFGCRWDSGKVGYIYARKSDIRKEYGRKRMSNKLHNHILDIMRAEVKTFDLFIRGEVYAFEIRDNDTDEFIDGCSGFYGSDPLENGMADHFEKELVFLLEDAMENIVY